MDGIGTGGSLTLVPTTQPLGTPSSVASIAGMTRKKILPEQVYAAMESANRRMPVDLEATRCGFTPIGSRRRTDDMIVELSAPLVHPSGLGAGLFARVVLGDQQEEWYWVALGSRGAQWGVAGIKAIAK